MNRAFQNPPPDEIKSLLLKVKTIAVLGLSPQPGRPSHAVARALKGTGFRIVPVRPEADEVLGERAYATLRDIPFPVDLVDVFRAAEYIPAVVEECIALRVPALWIQEGIVHDEAGCRAQEAGIFTVMDRCLWKEYLALGTAD